MSAQKHLFEIIKSRIPEQYRLTDVIEELLGVSSDSAYRRIRGEKELSFTELRKLCQHFGLSMDEILNFKTGQSVLFRFTTVNMTEQTSYIHYIERLSDTLALFRSSEDSELLFTAQDIPFYHFLNHTELMFFKLYAWHDTVSKERISFRTFCDRLDRDAIIPIYKQMHQSWLQIPSKEIWTPQTIDTVLRLLDYYVETGAFDSRDTVFLLLAQLSDLLETVVNVHAKDGYKNREKQTPFSMYICSVDMENSYMLTRRGEQKICTLKLYTVNSIATDNAALCDETQKWIDSLIKKSILISGGTSERERFRFFQVSRNKIDELVEKTGTLERF
jgi:plasmid maintenance system antidote protein VapI